MLEHGERDARYATNALIFTPEEEIKERLASPAYIFYFNKERQSKYERKLRSDMAQFIDSETNKIISNL